MTHSLVRLRHLILFALFGVLLFASDLLMESLPNVHFVGVLLAAFTLVYRKKALYILAVYVFLIGLFYGFSTWWIPYLYVWLPLWGAVLLVPKNIKPRPAFFLLPLLCALHGLCFGTLYAPMQALLFGLSFEQMLLWIAAGFPFDLLHAAANLAGGLCIVPFAKLLEKLEQKISV